MPFSKRKAARTAASLAWKMPKTPTGWAWFIGKKLIGRSGDSSPKLPWAIEWLCVARFLQFVLALAVVGLYGQDVDKWRRQGAHISTGWGYATALGGVCAVVSLLFWLVDWFRVHYLSFVGDTFLALCWLICFGIFGKLYIADPNTNADKNVTRMKHAVWVVLANWLLWCLTSAVMAFYWWREKSATATAEREQYDEEKPPAV